MCPNNHFLSNEEYHDWRFKKATIFALSSPTDYSSFSIPPSQEEDPSTFSLPPTPPRPFIFPPPGFDGIPLESLSTLSAHAQSVINDLFHTCSFDGFIADPWKLVHVICVADDDYHDRPTSDPKQYDWKNRIESSIQFDSFKYVFLHSSAYRVFSSLQTKRLAKVVSPKISVLNRGYFPCNSISAGKMRCPEISRTLSLLSLNRDSFYCGLLDLDIGFGTVLHSSVKATLKSYSVAGSLLSLCLDSLNDRRAIFFGPCGAIDGLTPISLTSNGLGLISGDPLHRLIYLLVLDPLVSFIHKCRPSFGIEFKDFHFDIILFSGQLLFISKDIKSMKKLINKIIDYCHSVGILLQPQLLYCSHFDRGVNSKSGISLSNIEKETLELPMITSRVVSQFPLAQPLLELGLVK
ncbi:hypothetical protein P9112_012919 [Eukaryota sp. TZLM1-RC]